jgi:thiamine-phosphate pyrophosphorylase
LLRGAGGTPLDASVAKTLTIAAQKLGVAVLVEGDANLARMIKADGIHVSWSKDPLKSYKEAREIMGAHAMIGVDVGRSRDDAMAAGEEGADYIAFGIPARVEDRAKGEARQLELVEWWSEIFEVPCVAFDVATKEHARDLANSGAEFITVVVTPDMSPADAARHVAEFAAIVAPAEATA